MVGGILLQSYPGHGERRILPLGNDTVMAGRAVHPSVTGTLRIDESIVFAVSSLKLDNVRP